MIHSEYRLALQLLLSKRGGPETGSYMNGREWKSLSFMCLWLPLLVRSLLTPVIHMLMPKRHHLEQPVSMSLAQVLLLVRYDQYILRNGVEVLHRLLLCGLKGDASVPE